MTSIDVDAANLNNTALDVDSLVTSGRNSIAQIQTKGIGVRLSIKAACLLGLSCAFWVYHVILKGDVAQTDDVQGLNSFA